MKKRRNIFGVSWRKLQESPLSPASERQELAPTNASTRKVESSGSGSSVTQRLATFRDTLGTLKQKIKMPSRTNMKRLTNSTPSPFGSARKYATPSSSGRRLSQRTRREVKMYSPFEVITPMRTPAKSIKMGTQGCKRFTFSSAGNADFEKEVTSIADGIQTLVHTSKSIGSPAFALDGRSRRSGIRTTPKGGRAESKKPLFV